VIATDATLDTAALMRAEPAEKISVVLAWQEHFKPINSQSQRDEWARAFGRKMMAYLSTTQPN
jgi:hypothetical protein